MTRDISMAAGLLAAVAFFTAASAEAGSVPPNGASITVGETRFGNCTADNIAGALTEAKKRWDRGDGRQEIRITRDVAGGVWIDTNVEIKDMDVTIIGGFANCDTDDLDGVTVVSGEFGDRAPVFSIRGQAEVSFDRVDVYRGDVDAGARGENRAGGIDFFARGSLRLSNMSLTSNIGVQGGAIRFETDGGKAELNLVSNVAITGNRGFKGGGIAMMGHDANYVTLHTGPNVSISENNTSGGSGGGIFSSGRAYLDLRGPNSQLHSNQAQDNGGGLEFDGTGEVTLNDFLVQGNTATYGGGLHLDAAPPSALFTIGNNVTIVGNAATNNGGGMHVDGPGQLYMMGTNTQVSYNGSAERGGGLYVKGPAQAYVGAAGSVPGAAVFYANGAKRGGAIALNHDTGGVSTAWLYLFTAHPQYPMTLSENTASERGGAVYGVGEEGGTSAHVCMQDTSMFQNIAPFGAAVYVDSDDTSDLTSGTRFELNYLGVCSFPQEAMHCSGPLCNQVTFNRTEFIGGARTTGGVFEVADISTCNSNDPGLPCPAPEHTVSGVVMRDNKAGSLVKGGMAIKVENVAGYRNQVSMALLAGKVDLLHGSFAGNTGGNFALNIEKGSARSSLFLLPNGQELMNNAYRNNVVATHVFSNDLSGTPADATNYVMLDPGFVNGQGPDFDLHLRADGAAIDTAPAPAGLSTDIEGQARNVDIAGRGAQFDTADRGAYEFQGGNAGLLRDGFEQRN